MANEQTFPDQERELSGDVLPQDAAVHSPIDPLHQISANQLPALPIEEVDPGFDKLIPTSTSYGFNELWLDQILWDDSRAIEGSSHFPTFHIYGLSPTIPLRPSTDDESLQYRL